jgi:hypothetical protein
MGAIGEAFFSYMDDINNLAEDENDILFTHEICQVFRAITGAILNRNRKRVVLDLGFWEGNWVGCCPG